MTDQSPGSSVTGQRIIDDVFNNLAELPRGRHQFPHAPIPDSKPACAVSKVWNATTWQRPGARVSRLFCFDGTESGSADHGGKLDIVESSVKHTEVTMPLNH